MSTPASDEYPPSPPSYELRRSYKAYCPLCGCISFSFNIKQRRISCTQCYDRCIQIVTRFVIKKVMARRYKTFIKNREIFRWFIRHNIDMKDIRDSISAFARE